MFRTELKISSEKSWDIVNDSITASEYHAHNDLLGLGTFHGRVILSRVINENTLKPVTSSVQVSDRIVTGLSWINKYTFVVSSSEGDITSVDIMNLVFDTYHPHSSGITSLICDGSIVYSSSLDGSIVLLDPKQGQTVETALHKKYGKLQAVLGLAVEDPYIYSLTQEQGTFWLWDKRKLSKPILHKKSNIPLVNISLINRNLYALGPSAVVAVPQNLSIIEQVYRAVPNTLCKTTSIGFIPCFNSFIWCYKDMVCLSDSNFRNFTLLDSTELIGAVFTESNQFFTFSETGRVTCSKVNRMAYPSFY